ncbi:E3 ubiquitin-protein ligase [Sesbania bispinosa]|nr:E3 ubiquitin-protein ligase [Sesbania bispinosa]
MLSLPLFNNVVMVTVCPDFDLCADQLPPPHLRDHPKTAIPIEKSTPSNQQGGKRKWIPGGEGAYRIP